MIPRTVKMYKFMRCVRKRITVVIITSRILHVKNFLYILTNNFPREFCVNTGKKHDRSKITVLIRKTVI